MHLPKMSEYKRRKDGEEEEVCKCTKCIWRLKRYFGNLIIISLCRVHNTLQPLKVLGGTFE